MTRKVRGGDGSVQSAMSSIFANREMCYSGRDGFDKVNVPA